MITVHYFIPNAHRSTKIEFSDINVPLSKITDLADKLDYPVFNAYENHAFIGYGTKFANGWNYHAY